MKKQIKYSGLIALFLVISLNGFAQGASVAPSRLFYSTSPGTTESQVLNVTNNSSTKQGYTIDFADFEPDGIKGKTKMMQHGVSLHSLKSNISATPNFFELEPGQTQEVTLTVTLANVPEANQVKWGSVIVRLAREKKSEDDMNQMGFGIMESFQFVIYVFQTPPAINLKRAEIVGFKTMRNDADKHGILLTVDNTGEAIVNCASYVELTSFNTGSVERIGIKAFTMLPDTEREIFYVLPDSLQKGTYSALGVVDFGSREEVEAAQLELIIE